MSHNRPVPMVLIRNLTLWASQSRVYVVCDVTRVYEE